MTGQEEWRPVVGWEGLYEVSSLGRVRSLRRLVPQQNRWRQTIFREIPSRVLAPFEQQGYLAVDLSSDNIPVRSSIHRLVACAFLGLPEPDEMVAHFDGNRKNNALTNLRWATALENSQDAIRHGKTQRGEIAYNAALNSGDVFVIRQSNMSQRQLADRYGVSRSCIQAVQNRRTWKHL